MSKHFLYAMPLAAMIIAGCSKNGPAPDPDPEPDTPAAVTLGTSVEETASTKGGGAVDVWDAAQTLYVYSFPRNIDTGVLDLTQPFIDNVGGSAPNGTRSGSISLWNPDAVKEGDPTYHEPFYYDPMLIYDFFGYYVDDACGESKPATVRNETTVTLPININGTQDVMLAATDKQADSLRAYQASGGLQVPTLRYYSAYSSRRMVSPTLIFRHQLSRFRFVVQSGNKQTDNTDPVTLTKLTLDSYAAGTLTILDDHAGGQALTPSGELQQLSLHVGADQHELSAADGIVLSWDHPGPIALDGAILVMPGREQYTVRMTFTQVGFAGEFSNQTVIDFRNLQGRDESMGTITTAQPGEQYLVTLVVYGREKVIVNVSLEDWKDGGTFYHDPDAD